MPSLAVRCHVTYALTRMRMRKPVERWGSIAMMSSHRLFKHTESKRLWAKSVLSIRRSFKMMNVPTDDMDRSRGHGSTTVVDSHGKHSQSQSKQIFCSPFLLYYNVTSPYRNAKRMIRSRGSPLSQPADQTRRTSDLRRSRCHGRHRQTG